MLGASEDKERATYDKVKTDMTSGEASRWRALQPSASLQQCEQRELSDLPPLEL